MNTSKYVSLCTESISARSLQEAILVIYEMKVIFVDLLTACEGPDILLAIPLTIPAGAQGPVRVPNLFGTFHVDHWSDHRRAIRQPLERH